jgi:gas vesicle protein
MTNNDYLASALFFTAGLCVGTAVVLLTAPRSGADTRRLIAEGAYKGAKRVVGEERIERGRRAVERAGEVRDLARDTFDVAKRARRVRRPLVEDEEAAEEI